MKHRLRTKVFFYLYDNLRLDYSYTFSDVLQVEGIFGRWYIYIFGCSAGGGDFWKVVQQSVGFRYEVFFYLHDNLRFGCSAGGGDF